MESVELELAERDVEDLPQRGDAAAGHVLINDVTPRWRIGSLRG